MSEARAREKPVLVTGGTGFLGSHVIERLSKAGRRVRALVRRTSDTSFLEGLEGVELAEGSVSDPDSLASATRGVDAVIHSAGLIKAKRPEEFNATNAKGTEALLDAAKKSGVRRFVLVSSLAAGGPSHDGLPLPASAPARPVTHYGRSKLAAERATIAAKDEIEVVVIRPPTIYGPRDREVLAFFKSVKLGVLPSVVANDSKLTMIFGPDCADACIAAADRPVESGSLFHVDDGEIYRFEDTVRAVERALNKKLFVRFGLPRSLLRAAALGSELYGRATDTAMIFTRDKLNELFAPNWVSDSTEARAVLEWRSEVSLDEGFARTAAWYRAAGWL